MLKEALTELASIVAKSRDIKAFPVFEGQPPDVRYIYNPAEGKCVEVPIEPLPRKHTVTTLESLSRAFKRYGSGLSTVWCKMDCIVLVIDDDSQSFRRESVTLPLNESPIFSALVAMDDVGYSQKDLYRLLKHDLCQSHISPASFVSVIQNLRFASSQETTGQVSNVGKNTFGRSTMAVVTGAVEIPEEVSFTFEPWPNSGIWLPGKSPEVIVHCSVFTDVVDSEITLAIMPGEMEAARASALDELCARVAEVLQIEPGNVFAGSP